MVKKALALLLTVALTATVAIGGTVAYLQDTDEQANTMTMGSVKIDQHEYERAVNADGSFVTYTETERDGNPTGYKLTGFTQDKPLYPATGSVTGWGDTKIYFAQLPDESTKGFMNVLDGLDNVVDKFVFVENKGKSSAYVRTLIAYECGSLMAEKFDELVMTAENCYWKATDVGIAAINNTNYFVVEYVYDGNEYGDGGVLVKENANGKHPGGVVTPGEFTYCSLGQVYLKNTATNEDCEALDANGNGKYDIIVLSQAVQTAGFDDPQTALDTAFGDVTTEKCAEWFAHIAPKVVTSGEELQDAINNGNSNIVLGDDIDLSGGITIG